MIRFPKPNDRERALLIAVPAIAIYASLERFMQEERAFLIGLSIYVFAIIENKWDRRRETWFWVALAMFAAAHAVVLSTIRIPHFTGPSLSIAAPFMFIDGFAMWGILSWIERRTPTKSA